ncbi:MAG: recombinase family protein [Bacillota bacterium]|uniref:recombinase family protein n=1 Tax=Cytobacillus firmus TaxID=1399 RepID=UPI0018CEB96B|nr:recombinase family protein [Cytobacillus firmus]MED4448783.1 recombinase family protein [Cytobacillus firmus]MED4769314.1 recombinase family protein [Cytobacillus firmus]
MGKINAPSISGSKENGMIRVAAYCRTSTSHDEMTRSLENQVRHYTRYIQGKENYKLIGIYYDRGKSGMTKEKRPGFQRLLRHCEEQRIDLILTKSVSRFSRNSKDLLEIVNRLKELGISVQFEREKINTLDLKNTFFLTTLAAIAQEESRTISETTRWGFEKRFQSGIPHFQAQLGYEVVENKRVSIVKIIEEEAVIVREIFERFNSGMKKSDIARMLIERGVKTTKGNDIWTNTTVHRILTNRNYTGDKLTHEKVRDYLRAGYKSNGGTEKQFFIENSHPAIISRETFNQAQSLLEKYSSKFKARKYSPKNRETPLSKRITCGLCDNNYQHSKATWICRRRKASQHLCDSEKITEKELLEMTIMGFQQRYDFSNPKVLKQMLFDIKHMNKNDHFEYRRLLYFSEMEMAREVAFSKEKYLTTRGREEIEQELRAFEEWATKIEEDRKYRNQAIEWIARVTSTEQFLNELTIDYMRAWIISIKVFSQEAFIIRWLDQGETKIGNCVVPEKPVENKVEHEQVLPTAPNKAPEVPVEKGDPNLNGQVTVLEINPLNNVTTNKNETELYAKRRSNPTKGKSDQPRIRTAAYARISTEIPHQLGSLETQIAYYTYHILKDPNQSLVKVYAEKGVSGTNTDHRKEFQRLIEDCKKGKIDRIITKSISRFGRNTVDVLETVRMLKALKPPVEVVFQKENIRTLDEDGEVMLTIYSGLAQEESRNLAESVAWGKRRLAERGKINTRHPRYGYDYDEDGDLVINPVQGEVIRRIYRDFLAGKNTNLIAKELSDDGIKTVRGKSKWHCRSIDCMITNPIYKGDLIFQQFYVTDTLTGKTVKNQGDLPQYIIQDNHPALVNREDWEAAQQLINNRSNKKGKSIKPHTRQEFFNTFTCSECDSPIIHIRCSSDGSHYWRCRTAEKKYTEVICNVRGFREESIEHRFMTLLQELKMTKGFKDEINQTYNRLLPNKDERKRIEQVRDDMQQHYHQLYDEVDEGERHGGDPNRIKGITDKIVDLQNQVYDFEDREQQCLEAEKDLDWFFEELKGIQDFKPEKERIGFRADIFSRIVEKGTVYPDGRIVYDLKFGMQVTTEQNDMMAWRLRKKGKPRKRKKK